MKNKTVLMFAKGFVLFWIAVFLLIPMIIVVITAMKPPSEFVKNPVGLPSVLYFTNFSDAVTKAKMLEYSKNSLFVLVVSVALIVVADVACAYGLSKTMHKRIGKALYLFIMFGLMLGGANYVTMLLLYRNFGLYNSLWGVIVSTVAGSVPLAVFLLVGFIRALPADIMEAADIDGCSPLRSLVHIVIPLITPAISTIVILNMVTCWNNMLTPLLLLKDKNLYTVPLGLLSLRGTYRTDYTVLFAAMLISAVPLIVSYLALQKKFVESLAGSLKG